ncbi:P12 [Trabala vishnou gigantina nucleopolyhedrovirus]|uniref:P12 n=1 Tax=Trabala vishnou gigantina nucleopolyhedrovirus TaxID=2863583 RepID=UPI0024819A62|nr:P12 [Trabala vishnou gigantina nucleopolyhedrovirus]QYC92763.1 P12 [Trabala vishnou gigantina nucleopolyhedrovirus]
MSDNFLIDTMNGVDNVLSVNNESKNNRKRNTKRKEATETTKRDSRFDPVEYIDPSDLINALNENDRTVANLILNDNSDRKVQTFKLLSKSSGVAKTILKDIEENKEGLRLNTVRATNVLRLLSNVYDNQV